MALRVFAALCTASCITATLVIGGGAVLTPASVSAQTSQQNQKRSTIQPVATTRRSTTTTTTPPRSSPRTYTPPARITTPRVAPTITPRTNPSFTPRPNYTVTPRTPLTASPRVVTPRITTAPASRLRTLPPRGAGNTYIRGQNFSAWRSGYRVWRGNRWRTFVTLSLLSPIFYGFSYYYPYAYISAPQDYCDGTTEDGCQLVWQGVETLEGAAEYQCVAYCPWQQ